MIHRLLLFIAILSTVFTSGNGHAQGGEEERVSLVFRTFAWGGSLGDVFFDDASGKPTSVLIKENYRSPYYQYLGMNPIRFYRMVSQSDGTSSKATIANVQLPKGAVELMIFFIFNANQERITRVIAVDDSLESFPLGSMRILNFAEKQLVFKMGETQFVLEPGEIEVVPVSEGQENTIQVLAAARNGDGQMRIMYSTTWSMREGDRQIVFLLPKRNSMLVKKFPESGFALKTYRYQLHNQN